MGFKSRKTGPLNSLLMITLLVAAVMNAPGQTLVDKTVATVSDGLRTELITLSDLRWQLALQPNVSLSPPASADLNRALNLLIDQRLFALEAERLPRNPPTEKEISDKIAEILTYFPTTAEFESRLRAVGFRSIRDDNFERIIAQRVSIDKYLDFRFRSFIIVTSEDEANYYRDFFVPDFRRRFPDLLMPTLDEKRREINKILTEDRIAAAIEAFLDDAKRRAEIVILSEV
ncbi:MAG TPA: hypothetical protein DDW24_13675 [Blastocatellia bacterium]|nr:hypothetical protein [Blastocatellia bacterium]